MKVVTEENYKQIVLKRMIALCWAFLLICFIVKIFGGNFFAFIGESKFVEFIAERMYLLVPFQMMFYIPGTYLFYLTITNNKHKVLSLIFVLIMCLFKQLVKIGELFVIIALIVEFLFMFIIPVIVFKCNILKVVLLNILLILFQIISLFTKNIGLVSFPRDNVVGYVFMIDYYIMVTLMYLYNKKGGKNMELGLWFLSKNKTQLEAYKKVVVKKHEKKIAKIDEKIAKAK